MSEKVIILLPTEKFLHRQILEGILEYGRHQGPWQFSFETGDRFARGLARGRAWGATGIIAMVREVRQLQAILALKKPAVLINPPMEATDMPRPPRRVTFVNRNQEDVGKTAAEYFLARGHRMFAFVGTPRPERWSQRRLEGFRARLAREGLTCTAYDGKLPLEQWLSGLPPGTALFTVRDRQALDVLGLCSDAGIPVPETLAVLGADNDEVLCESTTPSLSSIALDGYNCGHLCAMLLDRHLRGKKVEPLIDLAYPRVVTRQSTDTMFIPDPFLAKAIGIVRADLAARHTISGLAQTLGLSKRSLEMKAKRVLGRSLKEEINVVRLNEAVRLLSNSALPIAEVAERCGFCGASHLGTRFKAAFGYGPSVFRYQAPK